VSSHGLPRDARDGVGTRLRRLVFSMLALLVLLGAAGAGAVRIAAGQVDKLSNGYTPANDLHSTVLTLMLGSETAVRGYLITGDAAFLQPYQNAHDQILPTLDAAKSSLAGINAHSLDPALASERRLAQQWLTTYAEPVAAQRSGAPASPAQQQAGKHLFDQFRAANSTVANQLNAKRSELRAQSNRLRSMAMPLLVLATVVAMIIAATLAYRTSRSISRPLLRLRSIVGRLDRGDLTAQTDEYDGPSEVRALARAVNALGRRARAEAAEDRDIEQFRQRTRLVSATIRRTTNGAQMAEHLVRGLGNAFEVDRVWLHTFADERVPRLTAQWHRDALRPMPAASEPQVEMVRELAARLWQSGQIIAIDDHRTYEPTSAGRQPFDLAHAIGASASIVVPIGDSDTAFGLLWVAMHGHSRHWTLTETGIAQHLAADLAHSLVQAHVIERQAQAVQLLRELDQAKADFISTVSHELRTPLTSISGYLEMLQHGDAGRLPDQATDMLAVIDRNATRLRNLIEDLLTQSRIDAGRLRLDLTEVDIRTVLRIVQTAMAPMAVAGDVKLKFELPPPEVDLMLEGDPHQLEQVFTNLVSNAIKFTPGGGAITVSAMPDETDAVIVEVSDTGIGIPAAEFENLFQRFFRASNASAAALPGTGLGLAIVREIVQRHGGAIDVESELGAGTTLTVWLPKPPAGV